ncbi:hypothetical protein [Limosilactobacillus ingluviei]|uniref:hypothetical protein n=1 Tax=Limosilactobacillus ingluviei TaxID=148604 RepID=UPI0002E92B10|nr:hypothetical protein [Limosilactobacillus ingluviei]
MPTIASDCQGTSQQQTLCLQAALRTAQARYEQAHQVYLRTFAKAKRAQVVLETLQRDRNSSKQAPWVWLDQLEQARQRHRKIAQQTQQAFDAMAAARREVGRLKQKLTATLPGPAPLRGQRPVSQTVLAAAQAQALAEREGYSLAGDRVVDRQGRPVLGWLVQNGVAYDEHGYLVELPAALGPMKKVHCRLWAWLKHYWLGIS